MANSVLESKPKSSQRFEASAETGIFLAAAFSEKVQPNELQAFDFSLRGSVNERANQTACLALQGIIVAKLHQGGLLRTKDLKSALSAFWAEKPDGWSHYGSLMVSRKVCTNAELRAALAAEQGS